MDIEIDFQSVCVYHQVDIDINLCVCLSPGGHRDLSICVYVYHKVDMEIDSQSVCMFITRWT